MPTRAPKQTLPGSQSIERAIRLLRAVAEHNDRGAPLFRIANELGLHIATAHRILNALVREGLVTYDSVTKLYHLGLELYLLGHRAHQFNIRDRFRGALERIATVTEDTVFLTIRSGLDMLCIDRIEGASPIRAVPVNIGARRPLGIGAGSLALIAFLPHKECEKIIDANESRYPHYHNLTADDIREMARHYRPLGYTVSEGLFHEGVTSIGVPVFGEADQVIAAVTVSAISLRLGAQHWEKMVKLVNEITHREVALKSA